MNSSQYNGLMVVLHQILGRMPEPPAAAPKPLTVHHLDGTSTTTGQVVLGRRPPIVATPPAMPPVRTGWPHERYGPAPVASISRDLDGTVTKTAAGGRQRGEDPETTGARQALSTVLQALDGWVQGAKENHEAMGHRGENTGSECWRTFAPSDFRNMINDAATELGLATFPAPTEPEEDKAL